jgi:hydroxymethylbilane synthase
MNCSIKSITVGARGSPLSQTQILEVQRELQAVYPNIHFLPRWIETRGDRDLKTSLKTMPQSDFFTKEIDDQQLNYEFRISIHSAKDLPIPLARGLRRVALTKGVDPRDVLVLPSSVTIETLPLSAKIATSSLRREEEVRKLRADLTCVDIRGPIEKRLEQLHKGLIDGLVVAKAALIRLQLTHLNQILLEGPTAHYQGQLAVIARADDTEMADLFAPLDHARVLHTGLIPPNNRPYWHHYPMNQTIPLLPTLQLPLQEITH